MSEQSVEKILREARTIAVVGFSSNPGKAGYYVPAYLKRKGYIIHAINPNVSEGLDGDPAYASLDDVPKPIDLVLLFQRSENVPPFVDQAIESGAKAVWMQLGIANQAAAEKATAANLDVVQNACMLVEHQNWSGV